MRKTLSYALLAAFAAILCATSMGGGGMRRRMMVAASDLPAGCRHVANLRGGAATWIDTGISFADGLFACYTEFSAQTISHDKWAFGSWKTGNDRTSYQCGFYENKMLFIIPKGNFNYYTYDTNWHTCKINWNGETRFDSESDIGESYTTANNDTCCLFAKRIPSGIYTSPRCDWNIRFFKIADRATMNLRRDFIPIVAKANGVDTGFMYDRVTKDYLSYGNLGSGKFGWEELDGTIVAPT